MIRTISTLSILASAAMLCSCTTTTPRPVTYDPIESVVTSSGALADSLVTLTPLGEAEEAHQVLQSAWTRFADISDSARIAMFQPRIEVTKGASRASGPQGIGYFGAQLGTLALPGLVKDAFATISEHGGIDVDESAAAGDGSVVVSPDGTPAMRVIASYSGGLLSIQGDFRHADSASAVDVQTTGSIWGCPDADGQFTGTLTLNTTASINANGIVHSGAFEQVVELSGETNDNARISALSFGYRSTIRSDSGGGTGNTYIEASGSFDGTGGLEDVYQWEGGASIDRSSQAVSTSDADSFLETASATAEGTIALISVEVERFLRSGACVEVRTTPGPSAFGKPGQAMEIQVDGVSKADGALIKTGTATATLTSGSQSVSPDGDVQDLPARVTFVGPDADEEGVVSYEIVGRRGIGRLDVTYRIAQSWLLDYTWEGVRYHAVKCGDLAGDWVVTRKGVPEGNGGSLDAEITFSIEPVALLGYFNETGTLTLGADTMQGTYTGDVVLERQEDGTALMHIRATSGTITYRGVTASASDIRQEPPMPLTPVGNAECAG